MGIHPKCLQISGNGSFCKDISSCVVNNGVASKLFYLESAVRQGCHLSGIFFVIAMKLLAQKTWDGQTTSRVYIFKEMNMSSSRNMLMTQLPFLPMSSQFLIWQTVNPWTSYSFHLRKKFLSFGITKENLNKIYLLPFKATKEVKLAIYQHKLINSYSMSARWIWDYR